MAGRDFIVVGGSHRLAVNARFSDAIAKRGVKCKGKR